MEALFHSLLAAMSIAAMPRDVGLVEIRDDQIFARLAVPADQLEPYCRPGVDGEEEELPSEVVRNTTGWTLDAVVHLFVGPRRIGNGHVVEIGMGRGCTVEATIESDGPLPWTLPSDAMWATVRDRPSSPPVPVRRSWVRAAERAAARQLEGSQTNPRARAECLANLRVASRGFRKGAIVGISCDGDAASFGSVYLVRPNESVTAIRLPGIRADDPATLIDVIAPQADRILDLVVEVGTERGRERRWIRVTLPVADKGHQQPAKGGGQVPSVTPGAGVGA
jgi:hypothetical protein